VCPAVNQTTISSVIDDDTGRPRLVERGRMSPELIIVPALFVLIGFVVWTTVNAWQRRQQLKLMTEFNARLLDRLESGKDFTDLLLSQGGARLRGGPTGKGEADGVGEG